MAGKYFEELKIGEKFISPGRTITETDIVLFSGLSGDYNLPHTNEEWCKKTPFRSRIAHGLLIASIASGLSVRLGLFEGTGLAHLGTTIRFVAPVYPMDTLHVELEILGKKEMDANRGRVTVKLETINQDGKVVETEEINVMIARKLST